MRDMAKPTPDDPLPPEPQSLRRRRKGRIVRMRPAVQAIFLLIWAAPLAWINEHWGRVGRSIPSCVFHCYYAGGGLCPAASFSCPIGIMGQMAALGVVPWMAIGVIVLVGALAGSLTCGWACPFGFVQDLLARLPLPKLRIPNFLGYGRYIVLAVLVLALPYYMGLAGSPYEQQTMTTICNWCPAGAIEAGVPSTIHGLAYDKPAEVVSLKKAVIIVAFIVAAMVMFRPWCTILCPLGGMLSLFNRFSVFHLRFKRQACTQCNTCRSRCAYGVEVERKVNTTRCIRCLECTTCGAIEAALAKEKTSPPRHDDANHS